MSPSDIEEGVGWECILMLLHEGSQADSIDEHWRELTEDPLYAPQGWPAAKLARPS